MKPHNDTLAPMSPPFPLARASTASMASMLEEMGEVVKVIDRLALAIPPEHQPMAHEARTIRDAFDSRRKALLAMITKTI
jgi:hypothetical protein